jgi:hypothetical protein
MEITKILASLIAALVICFFPFIVWGIKDAINRKKFLANFAVGNVYGRLEITDADNPYAEETPIKWRYCFIITDIRYNKKKQLYYKYKICEPDGDFICDTTPHKIDKFSVAHFEDLVLIKNVQVKK